MNAMTMVNDIVKIFFFLTVGGEVYNGDIKI